MSEARYGFRLEPDGLVLDRVFGILTHDTLESAKHTGDKCVQGYIQYVVTHNDGKTWEIVETDDHRERSGGPLEHFEEDH